MDELLRIVNQVLEGKGHAHVNSISENTHLRNDLGLDSFDLAELTVRIEEEYEIDIFSDGLVNTVGEIMNKLKQRAQQ